MSLTESGPRGAGRRNAGRRNAGRRVAIIDGCRTPFLKANTHFKNLTSYDLARFPLKALLRRNNLAPEAVDRVVLGTVISNLQTSNVAREAMLGAGYQRQTPAFTVTQACISANQAIACGIEAILGEQASLVVAGGTECMSDIPIRYRRKFRQKLVESQRYRSPWDYRKFFKGLKIRDWLPEIPSISEFSTSRTMGQDCDRMAAKFGVSREAQDEFALDSHLKAADAAKKGILAQEIEAVRLPPKFETIHGDNGVRGDSTLEKLTRLKPAFNRPYGTITAGNASFLTDGAAAIILADEAKARELGLVPRAWVAGYVFVAQDPREELLLGPAYAAAKLLKSRGLGLNDIDVFEFHEAFAGQVLANLKCMASPEFSRENLKLETPLGQVPREKLNLHGGSLSLGHPFGATGARLVTTAANRLHRENGSLALVAACAAGAMGHAMLLKRFEGET